VRSSVWLIAAGAAALTAGSGVLAGQVTTKTATHTAPASDDSLGNTAAEALRKIADNPVAPKRAPQGYDVTIVTYADYQCPFCRKVHPMLERLAREDGKVRIVYRDWPIFGAASEEAAKAAIASQWQGKHAEFNDALMRTSGKLDSAKIRSAAKAAGVDWARLQADLDARSGEIAALIGSTNVQAAELGLQGTPALIVGHTLIAGAPDYAGLTEAVRSARQKAPAS
jgi:protein-disulfide isomerase